MLTQSQGKLPDEAAPATKAPGTCEAPSFGAHSSSQLPSRRTWLNSRGYWGLFAVLAALAVLGGRIEEYLHTSTPRFLERPFLQARPESVAELSFEANTVPRKGNLLPVAARGRVRVEAGPEGNVLVIDEKDGLVLHELTAAGEALGRISMPGEPRILSASDVAVQEHRIWVADLLGSRLHMFDRRTRIWESFAQKAEPYRVQVVHDTPELSRVRLLVMRVGGPRLFDLTRVNGAVEASAGQLLRNQDSHSLVLDGYIRKAGPIFIYAGKYQGVLAAFSKSGEVLYVGETISPPRAPVVRVEGGQSWVQHGPLLACLSLATSGEKAYLVTRRTRAGKIRSIVDTYDAATGGYESSFALPASEKWISAAAGNGYLFVASESRVARWPLSAMRSPSAALSLSTGRTIVDFDDNTKKGDL